MFSPNDNGLDPEPTSPGPFSPPGDRRRRFVAFAAKAGFDAVVTVGARYATWLAAYTGYRTGPSAVVTDASGNLLLVVPADELAVAERASAVPVMGYGEPGFGLDSHLESTLLATLSALPSVRKAARPAVAGIGQSAARSLFDDAEPSLADDGLRDLSLSKDADEAALIQHAYHLCWSAHREVRSLVTAGASEIEMYAAAQRVAHVEHGGPVEFSCDLLAGARTAGISCPVVVAGPDRPGPGEPVIADISVEASGYWADSCETYIRGENGELAEARHVLAGLLAEVAKELRPGVPAHRIHRVVSELLAERFPGTHFPHHAGHGVGLTPFEPPHLVPGDDTTLATGQIVAVEPGIYRDVGIRVERLFVITEEGGQEIRALHMPPSIQ